MSAKNKNEDKMNSDCNTAIKQNGKLCPCRLGLGHLGQHEYKEPTKKQTEHDISTEECVIGLAICSGIITLFGFSVIGRWFANDYWNLLGWGIVILTTFAFFGWVSCLGSLISNLYWQRKPDEIWIRNKNQQHYDDVWIKLENKDGVPKIN